MNKEKKGSVMGKTKRLLIAPAAPLLSFSVIN